MKYVAPVASGLGWSISETAAAIAAMSDAGIQGSQAGTSLRAALLSLASPTGQTEKAMKKFNIEVMDANGNMKPMPELVAHISERLGGLTKAQKTAALAQLVGREAASGFIAMIEKGGPELQKFTEKLENSKGVAEEVAKVQRDSLMGSLKEMQSAFEELGISIGNQFLPILKEVTGAVTGFARFLGDMNPQVIAAGSAFVAAAAGAGTLSSSIGLLLLGMRGLGPLFGPAGWMITGISILAGLYGAAAVSQDKMTETTVRQTAEMYKQNRETDAMIDRFEILRSQSNLTNKEFAEFLDIQKQLQDKSSLSKSEIKALSDRLKELKSKSSLTKDEWKELVDLNKKLVDLYPDHGTALSDLNEKYISNVNAIREMNAEQREQLRMELYAKLSKDLDSYNEKQERANALQKQYGQIASNLNKLRTQRKDLTKQISELEDDIVKAYEKGNFQEVERIKNTKIVTERKLEAKEKEIKKQEELLDGIVKERDQILKNEKALRRNVQQYADILLAENNINIESGKNLRGIYKRIAAIDDELGKYDERIKKGDNLSKQEREQYDLKRKEKAVLEHILEQVGARELFEEDIANILGKQTKEAKEQTKELNKKTERKHKYKDVKDEGKQAKENKKELKEKTTRAHNFASVSNENKTAKENNKELNKKTKKPHDSKEVKLALDTAQNLTKEANKKTKKPMDSSDIKKGHDQAKAVTKEANKASKKPLNYSSISNALSSARSLHEWLTAPASKTVSVFRNIFSREKKHQGGIVSEPPKFHQGGIADFTHGMGGITPGLGGVDARLLGREMVLTQFQQARLFNAINSGAVGGGGATRQELEEIADRIANRPVIVSAQFERREFARMVAEPVKEQTTRLVRRHNRWKGR